MCALTTFLSFPAEIDPSPIFFGGHHIHWRYIFGVFWVMAYTPKKITNHWTLIMEVDLSDVFPFLRGWGSASSRLNLRGKNHRGHAANVDRRPRQFLKMLMGGSAFGCLLGIRYINKPWSGIIYKWVYTIYKEYKHHLRYMCVFII